MAGTWSDYKMACSEGLIRNGFLPDKIREIYRTAMIKNLPLKSENYHKTILSDTDLGDVQVHGVRVFYYKKPNPLYDADYFYQSKWRGKRPTEKDMWLKLAHFADVCNE